MDVILFMVDDNMIRYLEKARFSHLDWCKQEGFSYEECMKIVCGYIYGRNIVYCCGDYKYDDNVIKVAVDTYEKIASDWELVEYDVYCGFVKGNGDKGWKPILKIK